MSTRQKADLTWSLVCLDPIFYLHHTYLDKLFWEWQQNGVGRLTAVGGPNVELANHTTQPRPASAFTAYNGDNGPTTTAAHVLWMAGIMGNVTISEVLDITGDIICAEYV